MKGALRRGAASVKDRAAFRRGRRVEEQAGLRARGGSGCVRGADRAAQRQHGHAREDRAPRRVRKPTQLRAALLATPRRTATMTPPPTSRGFGTEVPYPRFLSG